MNQAEAKARWAAMRHDPVLFADTFLARSPISPKRHDGQVNWLQGATQPINILIPGNRFGKSVVTAMRHIHHCVYKLGAKPDGRHTWKTMPYETINVSISADQAEIAFSEVKRLVDTPQMKPLVKRIYSTPFPHIVFFNGSVMHCRSAHEDGKYIDGHQYRLVTVDEAGWLKNDLKRLMNGVIVLRLAGGGMIDLIGTPKGYTDLYWYANRGLRGVANYYTQRGSIYDNPYLSADDLKIRDELLAQADERLREQVLYGAFVSDEGMAFTQDQLDQAFDAALPQHQKYDPMRVYVQAWDLGRKTDWTVGVTFDVTEIPYTLVDFQRLQKVPWEKIYGLIRAKQREYHVEMPVIDASGPGGDVIEEELGKRGVFSDAFKINSAAAKLNLVNTLQDALDHGRKQLQVKEVLDEAGFRREVPIMEPSGQGLGWGALRMPPIPQLLDEFGSYELDDKNLQQDCVMAVALAVRSVYTGIVEDPIDERGRSVLMDSDRMGICSQCGEDYPHSRLFPWLLNGGTRLLCEACSAQQRVDSDLAGVTFEP